MNTVLIIFTGIVLIILILLLTNLKISFKMRDVGDGSVFTSKVYIVKYIRVFKISKVFKSQKKSFKDQVKFLIDYLFKSKADPLKYAEKEMKKSENIPDLFKKIDISKMFIDFFSLDLRLDFDNAAVTAISTGAANAVLGMVLSKYANNIKGPARYKVYPGYTGEGVKINAELTLRMKILDIVTLLLKK